MYAQYFWKINFHYQNKIVQTKWFMQYSPATRATNITLATEGILAIQSPNPCPFGLGFQTNSL